MCKTVELSVERNWGHVFFGIKIGGYEIFSPSKLGGYEIFKADFPVGGYENFPSVPLGVMRISSLILGATIFFWDIEGVMKFFGLFENPLRPPVPQYLCPLPKSHLRLMQ